MMVAVSSSTVVAERISCYCALLTALMLALSCCEVSDGEFNMFVQRNQELLNNLESIGAAASDSKAACDEIYVVKEGETLHTISVKCRDPFIVEENPHIHDPDDVFPGLVIRITPFKDRS